MAVLDRADLLQRGFEGFVPVGRIPFELHTIPSGPGVYVVVRESLDPPVFVPTSPASWFKGQDPTVSIERLQAEWVVGATTLYFGSGKDLQARIALLAEFSQAGPEKSVFHRGGRLLWQLADAQSFVVAWKNTPDGIGTTERDLAVEFSEAFGSLPFANLKMPPVRE